ncbi:MAG TPA: hypothetical protein VHH53_09815, partial [Pseudonocardiaceae bacterium]|nr:hypothetical protein [Pseudonocardiaceae bacterium]
MRTELSLPVNPSRRIRLSGCVSLLALLAGLGGCSSMFSVDEPAWCVMMDCWLAVEPVKAGSSMLNMLL